MDTRFNLIKYLTSNILLENEQKFNTNEKVNIMTTDIDKKIFVSNIQGKVKILDFYPKTNEYLVSIDKREYDFQKFLANANKYPEPPQTFKVKSNQLFRDNESPDILNSSEDQVLDFINNNKDKIIYNFGGGRSFSTKNPYEIHIDLEPRTRINHESQRQYIQQDITKPFKLKLPQVNYIKLDLVTHYYVDDLPELSNIASNIDKHLQPGGKLTMSSNDDRFDTLPTNLYFISLLKGKGYKVLKHPKIDEEYVKWLFGVPFNEIINLLPIDIEIFRKIQKKLIRDLNKHQRKWPNEYKLYWELKK